MFVNRALLKEGKRILVDNIDYEIISVTACISTRGDKFQVLLRDDNGNREERYFIVY